MATSILPGGIYIYVPCVLHFARQSFDGAPLRIRDCTFLASIRIRSKNLYYGGGRAGPAAGAP